MSALSVARPGGTLHYKALGARLNDDGAGVRGATSGAMMRNWRRRIRGAIGMGITWGAAWAVAGMMPRWVFGINADAPFPLIFGVLGFIGGIVFSAVLALTEAGRTLDEMSLPRFAGWGAIGGVLLSALFARAASLGLGDVLAVAPTFAVACAVCASGSLTIARRAEKRNLPAGRVDTAESALTDREKRKIFGSGD